MKYNCDAWVVLSYKDILHSSSMSEESLTKLFILIFLYDTFSKNIIQIKADTVGSCYLVDVKSHNHVKNLGVFAFKLYILLKNLVDEPLVSFDSIFNIRSGIVRDTIKLSSRGMVINYQIVLEENHEL